MFVSKNSGAGGLSTFGPGTPQHFFQLWLPGWVGGLVGGWVAGPTVIIRLSLFNLTKFDCPLELSLATLNIELS